MRKLVTLFALSAVTAFVGACRTPPGGAAPAGGGVLVRVDEGGTTWLVTDPRAAAGAGIKTGTTTDVKTDIKGLETFLVKTAEASPGDDDGLPTTHVRIDGHPACAYERVREVMVACVKARIWRVTFGMGDAELPADLPKDEGGPADAAVDAALRWLALNQEPDGRWEGEDVFAPADHYAPQRQGMNTDPGITGLALLAFLAAGHTEKTGVHTEAVRKGITYLISSQTGDGSIGKGFEGGLGYHHAIAGLALVEAYGMSRLPATGRAAQKAVDYSVSIHQAPRSGWRYNPKQAADTSVTGWFVQQLKSAAVAGLKVELGVFAGAAAFLDTCTKRGGAHEGRVSYQPHRPATPTMTAVAMYCRELMGWKRDHPRISGAADYLLDNLPSWEAGEVNFYYWYYGSLAMFHMGGRHWRAWDAAQRDMLLEHQRRGTGEAKLDGSWDPEGTWCGHGGRVYSTAMAALCLETHHRYLPLYPDTPAASPSTASPPSPPGGPGLRRAPLRRRPPPPAARRRPWMTEMRVRLYWVNARGQVIHSPERALPDDWEERSGGVRVVLSTDGAHLKIMVSRVRVEGVKIWAKDPEVVPPDELARMLDEVAVSDPDMPVVIDARRKVPFSFVFGVLDACRRAKVKEVLFDAPPEP